MAQQNRLDLARLNAEPAQLHLRVRPPQKLQNPVRPPARHIPAAVHPAPRPTMRVRNKPLRRQPRTAQIPPRKPRTRDVKLPRNPRRNRLQASVQHVHPVIRQSGARSGRAARPGRLPGAKPSRIDGDFRRSIKICKVTSGNAQPCRKSPAAMSLVKTSPPSRQVLQRITPCGDIAARRIANTDGTQRDKAHLMADDLRARMRRRFPCCIAA